MVVLIPLLVIALIFAARKRKSSDESRGDLGFVIVILVLAWMVWSAQTYLAH